VTKFIYIHAGLCIFAITNQIKTSVLRHHSTTYNSNAFSQHLVSLILS